MVPIHQSFTCLSNKSKMEFKCTLSSLARYHGYFIQLLNKVKAKIKSFTLNIANSLSGLRILNV